MNLPEDIPGMNDLIGKRLDSVTWDSDTDEIIMCFEGHELALIVEETDDGDIVIGLYTDQRELN